MLGILTLAWPVEHETERPGQTHRRGPEVGHPAGMAVAEIGLRRLVSQGLAARSCEHPAEVVRLLGALQAQDYRRSLWAIASRMRAGTVEGIERAIAERAL